MKDEIYLVKYKNDVYKNEFYKMFFSHIFKCLTI